MTLLEKYNHKTACTFDLVSNHDAVCISALCAGEPPKTWARKANGVGHFSYLNVEL